MPESGPTPPTPPPPSTRSADSVDRREASHASTASSADTGCAPSRRGRGWRRWLLWPLGVLALLVVVVEEVLWPLMADLLDALGRVPGLRRLGDWAQSALHRLPPWGAALLFLIPALTLLPVKLFGLWLIGNGHPAAGITVFIGGKLSGTAAAAWIFRHTEPKLRQMRWFDRALILLLLAKNRLKAWALGLPGLAQALARARDLVQAARSVWQAWRQRAGRGVLRRAFDRLRDKHRRAWRS